MYSSRAKRLILLCLIWFLRKTVYLNDILPSLYLPNKITKVRIVTMFVIVSIPASSQIKHVLLFDIHQSTDLTHRCNFSLVIAIKQQPNIFIRDRYIFILHFTFQFPKYWFFNSSPHTFANACRTIQILSHINSLLIKLSLSTSTKWISVRIT